MHTHVKRLLLATTLHLGVGCTLPGLVLNDDDGSDVWRDGSENEIVPAIAQITPDLIRKQHQLKRKQARQQTRQPKDANQYQYRVGAQDVLSIVVWGHPDLTNPTGDFRSAESNGRLVRRDGTIFFPYIGLVKVAGKTLEEVRGLITWKLASYIENPQVDVRVAAFRSQRVFVAGEGINPCIRPISDSVLTLVEAINTCGGVKEAADGARVQLHRNKESYTFNLYDLYANPGKHKDVTLQDGDRIYVPDNRDNAVFLVGEVSTQQALPMPKGRLTLAAALASGGGMNLARADSGGIFVLRGIGGKAFFEGNSQVFQPVVFQLDASSADALILADQFQLESRDIVYVAPASAIRWNAAIQQLLPTLNLLFQSVIIGRRT